MGKICIGLLQHECGEDIEKNFDRAVSLIIQAARKGAKIVCTQELFRSRYFCQNESYGPFKMAEPVTEKAATVRELSKWARKFKIVIIAALFEKRAEGVYHNTAVVIDADGKYLGKYRKMHIPDDPHFCEKFYFTPGDLGYKVFKTRYANIGVLICWDQWYPEAARATALKGAQVIFYPTAIGWLPAEKAKFGPIQYSSWEIAQRGHAIANGCYVASVNRVGYEPSPSGKGGIEFWGQSFVADPYGEILQKASADKSGLLLADLDLDLIDTKRVHWPFLRDRRIDSYGDILKRFVDE